jgi:RNA polymerase sigma-70 factor (ECF subfamily)
MWRVHRSMQEAERSPGPLVEIELATADEPPLRKPGFVEEAIPWLDAVYRFSLRLTGGNEDEAQDLTQETYLRAYRHWETYTPGTSCRSWLFTICRNAFLRGQEQRGRRHESLESELDFKVEAISSALTLGEIRASDPASEFFDSFVDEEITSAVAQLPVEFRDAVVLSDLEGLSYNEIAEVLDIPIGTVKSRLYRGRRLLAQALHAYAVDMGYIRGTKP